MGERRGIKIPGLSKLRIGGSVGKATEKVKSTLNNTKVLGVPLGAALGATQGLPQVLAAESSRAGGDLGQTVKNFGQDLTQGAKNLPLVLAGVKATGGNVPGIPGLPGGGGGGGGGQTLADWLDMGLGAGAAFNAANLAKKSSDFAQGAYDSTKQSYDAREPLRLAGVAGMLDPSKGVAQRLAGLNQIASRNTFAPKPGPGAPLTLAGASTPTANANMGPGSLVGGRSEESDRIGLTAPIKNFGVGTLIGGKSDESDRLGLTAPLKMGGAPLGGFAGGQLNAPADYKDDGNFIAALRGGGSPGVPLTMGDTGGGFASQLVKNAQPGVPLKLGGVNLSPVPKKPAPVLKMAGALQKPDDETSRGGMAL